MKTARVIICLVLTVFLFLLFVGCSAEPTSKYDGAVDATHHGVSTENSGEENSIALQALIDRLSENGGTVYIPAGEYEFTENGKQTIGSHCIKLRSNVNVIGDGENTVLKPTGCSEYGMDMFYFNEYLDTGEAVYLENCRFESFVIDASGTSTQTYTSAGKGFMVNLFKNCHWAGVTVRYTDATGFGVDCPMDCSISDCVAIGCGKAATEKNGGASGFGIGFGYAEGENIRITDCRSYDNKKFGFFFEHQGRFNTEMYNAQSMFDFTVINCASLGNLYGFGGVYAMNTVYENCYSENSRRYGFLFENSTRSSVLNCQSTDECEASFAVINTASDILWPENDLSFSSCICRSSSVGVKIVSEESAVPLLKTRVEGCIFYDTDRTVLATGAIHSLDLCDNVSDTAENYISASIVIFTDEDNSWN